MGKVIIQDFTTVKPITLMGIEAGVCWGADTNNEDKNYKRGERCLLDNHGRVIEYPQIYMILDGYSAKVIREFYTHNGGNPSRLQSSTRYIDYSDFDYVIPKSINTDMKEKIYKEAMDSISMYIQRLDELGVPREDSGMLLPLGMTTGVVVRTNLRQLIDMSRQRMCTRAYWEFRELMWDILKALEKYSEEWFYIVNQYEVFHAKCQDYGYCPETKGCGIYQKKGEQNGREQN